MVISTDQSGAATRAATHIHQRIVKEPDVIAEHFDCSALGSRSIAARIDGAGADDGGWGGGVVSAVNEDLTARTVGIVRGECAGIFNVPAGGAEINVSIACDDAVGANDSAVIDR